MIERARLRARPMIVALALAWLAIVVGLSLLAARMAIAADEDCAVELLSRGSRSCLVHG